MHNTVDYSKSPAPAFDAVEDIKQYLGDEYAGKLAVLRQTKNPQDWQMGCAMFLGIEGFPVRAWYEHVWGQGSWIEPARSHSNAL